ncbi:unnamed protein product [Brugia timori]|uniref:CHDNT domain-containing protein n=1 Tax=Brugia timori TaxID=42155 RepID=A0A0R3Q920_9BILA|nr:unnamed protein product [Brugia timori]
MEEDSVQSNEGDAAEEDHDDEDIAEETNALEHSRSTKRKKGSKKGRLKKRRESAIEQNASSAEICTMLGLNDVPNNFTEEDINSISSAKAFALRVKPQLQAANPKALFTKLQQLIQAKYREFQEEMAAQGRPIGSVKKSRSSASGDKVVAPIKIRISARKKRRNDDDDDDTNQDSDQEFEHLLKEHEKQLDEEEREKEERRAARARSAKKKGKKKKGEDGYEVCSYLCVLSLFICITRSSVLANLNKCCIISIISHFREAILTVTHCRRIIRIIVKFVNREER